jgi:8-oxo-dGTP diphosphatase
VTLYVVASGVEGEPEIMEPNKCLAWQWFGLDELPEPLFLSLENFLKQDKLQTLIDKR